MGKCACPCSCTKHAGLPVIPISSGSHALPDKHYLPVCKVKRSGCTQMWLCKALYLQALDKVLLACLDNLVVFTGDVMLFAQAL